jgi:hypothetical protein
MRHPSSKVLVIDVGKSMQETFAAANDGSKASAPVLLMRFACPMSSATSTIAFHRYSQLGIAGNGSHPYFHRHFVIQLDCFLMLYYC